MQTTDAAAHQFAEALQQRRLTVGVAESLTGGLLVQALARVEGSSEWLMGGIVAYHGDVKHQLLGVRDKVVVSANAVCQMASGAREVLRAGVGIAVTGVAGPDPQDDKPPGTVWMAADTGDGPVSALLHLEGDPKQICASSVAAVLAFATDVLTAGSVSRSPPEPYY
jgi:nicotinamide-nucleotide amidase